MRRRTITASSSRGRTGTPRVKRCGSRISSRLEKELEWPLCGVADKEQTVLETLSKPAHRAGKLAVDRIARPAGRRRMMRLVQD